jgi:hypothetical protein
MFNFNVAEVFSNLEAPLLEKAKNMDKISDIKELDKPINEYVLGLDDAESLSDEDVDIDDIMEDNDLLEAAEAYESKLSRCPIEGHNGSWDGLRGNSTWIPDRDAIPTRYNPDGLTWGQILDKYGIEGIDYKDGDPDFSPISKGEVEIDDFTDDRPSNFAQADEALAKQRGCSPEEVKKWREENGYTWHECRDCKTMQKVPREVHNNMDHSGGVSEYKKSQSSEGGES